MEPQAGSVPERRTGSVPERRTGSVPERRAGLGRSLNDVIESLTPADAPLARGTDLHDITPQLYRLVLDVQDLRDRVDRLEADGSGNGHSTSSKKTKKKRNGAGGKKTKKS